MRIEKFLNTFESKHTVKAYRNALRHYFKHIYPVLELEEAAERYFKEIRNYEDDISNYFASIKNKPPKTVQLFLSAVRVFLSENDVELSEKFWRKLRGRKKGTRALTVDKIPSNVELRKIIMHMPVHGKALFLTLASSGMRIGETLKLKLNDIELESDPVKINIRGEYTKSGNPRIAFISSEAKEAIQEWLKVRDKYLEAAVQKSTRYEKIKDDPRIFPFEDNTAYAIWTNAINKAGYNEKDGSTNRHKIHPHVLRKFFRTKMGSLIPVDVTEALMGHEGYLTEVYRKYSVEELAKFYKQGESALLIFTDGEEIAKLRKDLDERSGQIQKIINGVVAENIELKKQVKEMQDTIAAFKDAIEILRSYYGEDVLLLDPKTFKVVKVARKVLPPIDIRLEK